MTLVLLTLQKLEISTVSNGPLRLVKGFGFTRRHSKGNTDATRTIVDRNVV